MNNDEDYTKSSMGRALPENKFPKRDNEPNPGREQPEVNSVYSESENEAQDDSDQPSDAARYLAIRTRTAFKESSSFMDASLRRQWDDNIRMMQGRHPSGSKYHHNAYSGRSKLFRPKTRSAVRTHEAAAAAVLFSNADDLVIKAENPSDVAANDTARMVQQLVQYRLSNTIPWFLTALGAWQDTEVYGVCVSRQEWQYKEKKEKEYQIEMDEQGQPLMDEQGQMLASEVETARIIKDRPWIEHIPPDRFRFDPNADWRDVVNTSPFLIEQVPMRACDVLDMMEQEDPKTNKPIWYKYKLAEVLAAGNPNASNSDNTTNLTRAGQQRRDPQDTFNGDEFSTVYVHLNIIHEQGDDWVTWTIGDSLPLTEPELLRDVYPHGRPHKVGFSNIEAHRTYPAGTVEMGASLQEAINEVTNQRRDNVALALNKRYFIKRQKQGSIDLKALMRSVPGGGIMVDDPDDVKVVETNDVTASSYQEQDRMSVEMDELLGNFSQGSVMGNRKLNETVGGMSMMSSGATAVQDLSLRVFIETWVEPVLKDIARLEQLYETDDVVLHLAGEKAGLGELMREMATQDLLTEAPLSVSVNVGMGNTNPAQRIEKLSMALNTAAMFPGILARVNDEEIGKEIFGYAGYADGSRFLLPADQMKEQPDPGAAQAQADTEVAMAKLEAEREQFFARLEMERELGFAQLALKENMTMAEMQTRLELGSQKDATVRETTAVREANKARSDLLKLEKGAGT